MRRRPSTPLLPPLPDWRELESEAWAITTARRVLETRPSVEAARGSGEVLALRAALWRAEVPFLHREKLLEALTWAWAPSWPEALRTLSGRALDVVRPLTEAQRTEVADFDAWTRPHVPRARPAGVVDVTVLSGLPAAGKDSWLEAHRPGLPVVSLDALRHELGIDHGADQARLRTTAQARAAELLQQGRPFAWNSTLLRRRERRFLVEWLMQRGAQVTLVSLDVTAPLQRRRNRHRAARVPDEALQGMLDRWEPVLPGEAHFERFYEDGVERRFED